MERWKAVVSECAARPRELSAKQWLAEKGIPEKTYYYWQRRIRKEAYELMQTGPNAPAVTEVSPSPVSFAELPYAAADVGNAGFVPAVVIRRGGLTMEISNSASDRLLERILEVTNA